MLAPATLPVSRTRLAWILFRGSHLEGELRRGINMAWHALRRPDLTWAAWRQVMWRDEWADTPGYRYVKEKLLCAPLESPPGSPT